MLVCGQTDRLFNAGSVDIEDLYGLPFILREPGSGTGKLFEKQLEKHNVEIHEKWVCNNSETIKNAVIEGQGLAVISKRLVENELRENNCTLLKLIMYNLIENLN